MQSDAQIHSVKRYYSKNNEYLMSTFRIMILNKRTTLKKLSNNSCLSVSKSALNKTKQDFNKTKCIYWIKYASLYSILHNNSGSLLTVSIFKWLQIYSANTIFMSKKFWDYSTLRPILKTAFNQSFIDMCIWRLIFVTVDCYGPPKKCP